MTLHVIVKTNSYCKSFGNITELRFQGSFRAFYKWVNVPFITADPFGFLKIKILSLRGYRDFNYLNSCDEEIQYD